MAGIALAKYLRAKDLGANKKIVNQLYKDVARFNKKLKVEDNAYYQMILERPAKIADRLRGVKTRRGIVQRQERRMRF